MKHILLSSLLFIPFQPVYSKVKETSCARPKCFGNYYNMLLPCLDGSGVIRLNNTTVVNETKIQGTLTANDVVLNSLYIFGAASINTNSLVKGESNIFGSFEGSNTTFLEKINFTGNKFYLTSSQAKEIYIKATFDQQEIYLDNTLVEGNIYFEKEGGIVYSHISQINGYIIGGTIIVQ